MASQTSAQPILHCDKAESVLDAIEESWCEHKAKTGGTGLDLYVHLARVFNATGFVVDTCDGLEFLEHCRTRKLPLVDVLHALEDRVKQAGYTGGRLSVADCALNGRLVYMFFDSARFRDFAEVKRRAADRACGKDAAGAAS